MERSKKDFTVEQIAQITQIVQAQPGWFVRFSRTMGNIPDYITAPEGECRVACWGLTSEGSVLALIPEDGGGRLVPANHYSGFDGIFMT